MLRGEFGDRRSRGSEFPCERPTPAPYADLARNRRRGATASDQRQDFHHSCLQQGRNSYRRKLDSKFLLHWMTKSAPLQFPGIGTSASDPQGRRVGSWKIPMGDDVDRALRSRR
jgi:hypothetical protein